MSKGFATISDVPCSPGGCCGKENMDYGGFQRDFEGFRRAHGIGGSVSIRCQPEQPEIGSVAVISLEINGYDYLWLNIVGIRCVQVSNGDRVRIPVGAMPQDLILRDVDGAQLATHRLVPWVEQPMLRHFELPATVSYSTASVRGLVRAELTSQIKVYWQDSATGNAWVAAKMVGPRFEIPIPRAETELLVAVELRSRHAHLSEQGIQRIERTIVVKHPQPQFAVSALSQVQRFSDAHLDIDVKWVTELVVRHGEYEKRYLPDRHQQVRVLVPLATDTLGTRGYQILARGVDGGTHRRTASVEVLPRPVNCIFSHLDDGSVEFEIAGAQQLSLRIPSRCYCIHIEECTGVIQHDFLMRTVAELCFIDDLGNAHAKPVVLDKARHVWATPRPLPQALGWRG